MKILITGACGFIGSNLWHWLIENTDHEIVGIDNLSGGFRENAIVSDRSLFREMDVANDVGWLDTLFEREKFAVCYHFAAYASEGRSNYIRSFIHQNNTVGTANVINACVNHKCKLIFTSSVAVYSGQPPYTEETTPNPIDEYGLSKLMSEKSIQIAGEYQGLDWCIIRPRNVYGQRQNLYDPSRNVFGIWMNQILNDEPMTIYGGGSHIRSFTYVGDILKPLYEASNIRGEIINLGSENSYTIEQANKILQIITGHNKVVYLEQRHEVAAAYCATNKSRRLLNYVDRTSLEDGLTKMWAWAQQQPRRERMIPPPLEIKSTNHSSIV